MKGGITVGRSERPRSLHPHVKIALDGVADRPVDLQRLLCHKPRRVTCECFGHGDVYLERGRAVGLSLIHI